MQHCEWRTTIAGCLLATFVVLVVTAAPASTSPVADRIGGALDGKAKRPFCNAFTGCGRKRSVLQPPPPPPRDNELAAAGDGPAAEEPLLPSDAEALDDLANRILTEAKLWEQLQTKVDLIRVLASRLEDPRVLRETRSTGEDRKKRSEGGLGR